MSKSLYYAGPDVKNSTIEEKKTLDAKQKHDIMSRLAFPLIINTQPYTKT